MDIIERAVIKMGSAGQLAKELGISKQQLSGIRHGRYAATPYQVGKCAEICGERWYDHALPALMAQERTELGRAFWKGKLERLATTGAMALLAASWVHLCPNGDTQRENAAIAHNYQDAPLDSVYYVK